jgi:hypothetical protein
VTAVSLTNWRNRLGKVAVVLLVGGCGVAVNKGTAAAGRAGARAVLFDGGIVVTERGSAAKDGLGGQASNAGRLSRLGGGVVRGAYI